MHQAKVTENRPFELEKSHTICSKCKNSDQKTSELSAKRSLFHGNIHIGGNPFGNNSSGTMSGFQLNFSYSFRCSYITLMLSYMIPLSNQSETAVTQSFNSLGASKELITPSSSKLKLTTISFHFT